VPDTRRHRGPHPQDAELFAAAHHLPLRSAVADLAWLLSRGYAEPSSLKLVGDRYDLTERQRTAVRRSTASDEAITLRESKRVERDATAGETLEIDGFNLITTIEAALGGGVLLRGRDGCLRDMASMHGSYRKVEETKPALKLIGEALTALNPRQVRWLLDEPVSNSGRLKSIMRTLAEERNWPWLVELVPDPDRLLIKTDAVVVSADSAILDDCRRWLNLADEIVTEHLPEREVIDFCGV